MIEKMDLKNDKLVLSQSGSVDIPESIIQEWQSIVNLLARIERAKASLIMRISGQELEVFISSDGQENPYIVGQKEHYINSGLYCERVIKQGSMLLIPDASESVEWMNNPDMKLNMKCYMGFPIKMPDGNCFGTICVLDDKRNDFSQDMIDCKEKMRNLIESNLSLYHLSITDHLTGIYNRTYFNEKIKKELKDTDRKNQPIAAMIMDIDRFKVINDTYGHLAGDAVLANCAEIITNSVRDQDIAFRIGGDEFYVLMPNTSMDDAYVIAERVRENIENSRAGQDFPVTTSIGIAERLSDELSDQWYKRLDEALYKAKVQSGNQVAR